LTAAARRNLLRAGFVGYALLLFAATHKPNLAIPMPGRPDLVVHAVVFGLWTALLIAAGFFGPALSRRNLIAAALIAPAYAAFDEATQAIPFIRRQAAWDDFLFNLVGIAAVMSIAAIVVAWRARPSASSPAQEDSRLDAASRPGR
jgi:hypothetical protein